MPENPPADDEPQPTTSGLQDRFPGHFPPDDNQIRELITGGMIALDTNALFDAYRLNGQARDEYLGTLRLLGDRLWIPNRVGEEFLQRRLAVIKECSAAADELRETLGKEFDSITQSLRAFGNRRGLTP